LRQNPEEVERLVDQYLSEDQKWLENERQLNELRKRRNQMIERLSNIEKNNEKFDELLAQIKHKENE
jgi:seryl-tRNA synthetase